jgi:hypothetical protein
MMNRELRTGNRKIGSRRGRKDRSHPLVADGSGEKGALNWIKA